MSNVQTQINPRSAKIGRGFTIIELLVVISIVVLLIAILLPSMQEARRTTRRAVCLAQTKQIYYAWSEYLQGNFNILFDYTLQQPAATRKIWTGTLAPYLTEAGADVLICPETENPPGLEGVGNIGIAGVRMGNAKLAWVERRPQYHGVEPFDRASYTYNVNMCPRCQYGQAKDRNIAIHNLKEPDRIPVLGDGIWRESHPGEPGDIKIHPYDLSNPISGSTGAWDLVWRYATNRHGIMTNLVFADGHAESLYIKELWDQKWHKYYDVQTPVQMP